MFEPSDAPARTMRLTILGSGSPEAYVRRASSGYMLEVGGDTVLFDCGGGVFDNLLRAGKRPEDITHLYFTHLHSDHMMDYARLVHAAWDAGAAPLRVFGPAPIAQITRRLFGLEGVFAHDLAARTHVPSFGDTNGARRTTVPPEWPAPLVREITVDHVSDHGGWRVSTCEVPHAQPYLDCFAFAIESGGRKFVYSGDAGPSEALKTLATDADLLLHWCYRLDGKAASARKKALSPSPQQIMDMAACVGVKQVVLTHFRRRMDDRFAPDQVDTPLDWCVAEDLAVFEF